MEADNVGFGKSTTVISDDGRGFPIVVQDEDIPPEIEHEEIGSQKSAGDSCEKPFTEVVKVSEHEEIGSQKGTGDSCKKPFTEEKTDARVITDNDELQNAETDMVLVHKEQIQQINGMDIREVLQGDIYINFIDEYVRLLGQHFKLQLITPQFLYTTIQQRSCTIQRVPKEKSFVQVHFFNNHYVLSAQINGQLYVFDSIHSEEANGQNSDLLRQLTYVYEEVDESRIQYRVLQSQGAERLCGCFAAANAFAVLECIQRNIDIPKVTEFDTTQMRQHFHDCLETSQLSAFPCCEQLQSTDGGKNLIDIPDGSQRSIAHKLDVLEDEKTIPEPDIFEARKGNEKPELLKSLSEILKNGTNSPVARMQAGLQLKNALYSKDAALKIEYQQRWLQFPEDVRNFVKLNVLASLGTETVRPSSAAQCVANIACTELPQGLWPELINTLCNNVTNPGSTEMMKESCLEAIGYICQDIEPEILQTQSNEILTAIVHGMKKEETSNNVRNAATNALLNSLEFTKANFDKESERHFIMQVVCEATQSEDTRVRVAALQCLVKIMSLYYIYMEHYMGPALFAITMEAMKSDVDDIALQGIEFWSTVCDEEVDLAIELSEAAEAGKPPERTSRFYAKGALQYLVPILLACLTKQEEFDDDDEWNPCKAAGVCLMLMATCCEDDIIQYVLPFVKDNIHHEDWRFRDASVMAFGSILEGPDPTTLKQLVDQALPMLIESLKDPSVIVRDTGAWTIGRVCEILPEAVINEQFLNPLLHALVQGLETEPRVASNVCWAFSSLAEAAFENAEQPDDGSDPATCCLSSYFEQIVHKLMQTADRPDGNQNNLRNAAYEAIMEMMKNSTKDCYQIVLRTLVLVLEKLERVLQMENDIQMSSDRSQYNDLTSLLCATLQSVLRKVTSDDAPQISDQIMSTLLRMFQSSTGKSGGVQEDALLAVSTLTEVLSENFLKYMDAFKPFLFLALKNHAEYQVCIAAVGLVGDLSRALGQKILPYCDEIMMLLLENLGNVGVHRSVKPQILSIFGDIALAVGPYFKNYLEVVLTTLQQATQAQVDKTDYDMIDYLNELREGCLVAYTGMVQGLKGDAEQPNPDVALLQPHVSHMISFIEHIALDEDHSDSNISACCGLIGVATITDKYGACVFQHTTIKPSSTRVVYNSDTF